MPWEHESIHPERLAKTRRDGVPLPLVPAEARQACVDGAKISAPGPGMLKNIY